MVGLSRNSILSWLRRHGAVSVLSSYVIASTISASAEEGLLVAVSIPPQKEFVEQVAGEANVKVFVLLPPGANPSTYELTTDQMKQLSQARVFFKVGSFFPFEQVWLQKLADLNPGMLVVDCAKGISIRSGVEDHADHGDAQGRDPHVWCSLKNAGIMVDNIVRGLAAIEPEDSSRFAANAEAYKLKLDSLDNQNKALFDACPNREFLIFHPAWGYFAADYGLIQVPIESEGKEPHLDELKNLIQLAKRNSLKTVFVSPQFNPESARTIAEEIGGKVEYLDPLAENYLDNMREVAQKIAASLGKK